MVNKCAVFNCRSGYKSKKNESSFLSASKAVFSFPKDTVLEEKWMKFVNRKDWKPSKHSVICLDYFEKKYLKYGKRVTLKYELNHVPTIYSDEISIPSSIIPKIPTFRKPPTDRHSIILDEIYTFQEMDKIKNIDMLHESNSPNGFSFQRYESFVLYYCLFFVDATPFIESIRIDNNLHVKLHYKILHFHSLNGLGQLTIVSLQVY
ncbi:THAP domain-containing protein 2-like [Hydra vulgaris]|uniref:THAP domain-containing protein 2-like n=1 Tax=Hydra vulgaris TaxID=6087 RepID=UPI0002B47EED|nr:THAP domain-containing protein 2-like [Hydra vulgaris]